MSIWEILQHIKGTWYGFQKYCVLHKYSGDSCYIGDLIRIHLPGAAKYTGCEIPATVLCAWIRIVHQISMDDIKTHYNTHTSRGGGVCRQNRCYFTWLYANVVDLTHTFQRWW